MSRLDRDYIALRYADIGREGIPALAEELGCTAERLTRILRKELGILPYLRPRHSAEERAEAQKLLDRTIPLREAASILGVKRSWLADNFPGYGLAPEFVGDYISARKLERKVIDGNLETY